MKLRLLTLIAVLCVYTAQAQTAEEIIAKYFENTGGIDKWKAIQGVKISAKVNQQGMEIPLAIYQLKDGRQMTVVTFQGKEIKDDVYDGITLWGTNPATMKPERRDAEATENFKANLGSDYPFTFVDYKTRGFKLELLGKESVDGTETFKLKLTKNPIKVDGKPSETIEFYYFDTENFVPLMTESEIKSGPMKGKIGQIKFSDYQDVEGLLVPFSMTQGIKDMGSQPLIITAIELNPKVDAAVLAYVEEK